MSKKFKAAKKQALMGLELAEHNVKQSSKVLFEAHGDAQGIIMAEAVVCLLKWYANYIHQSDLSIP